MPLFYFVAHFFAAHIVAVVLAWIRYGPAALAFTFHPMPSMAGPRELFPPNFGYHLWVAYLVWLLVVVGLYPVCRWFARVKARRGRLVAAISLAPLVGVECRTGRGEILMLTRCLRRQWILAAAFLTLALGTTLLAHWGVQDGPGDARNRMYPSARSGGNYMHNYYFPMAPSSTPWYPAWTPDGKRITVSMGGSIWNVDPQTGIADELAFGSKYHSSPDVVARRQVARLHRGR